MILLFYIILNFLSTFVFFAFQKKHLHILEILTYWLFGSLLIQNYSAFNHINFKLFVISDVLSLELAHFLNRIVLEPLVIVWFLNYYAANTSFGKRALLIAAFVCILVGLEWFADWLGVFRHNGWKVWWSFTVWLTSILLSIGFMKVFRNKLIKGVQRNEL